MELTINNLIKIILGVFVFVVVVIGLYLFFKNYVIDFFRNFSFNETSKFILGIVKFSPHASPTNLFCSSLLLVGLMPKLLSIKNEN